MVDSPRVAGLLRVRWISKRDNDKGLDYTY